MNRFTGAHLNPSPGSSPTHRPRRPQQPQLPFYALPPSVKSSSQIINEAKEFVRMSSAGSEPSLHLPGGAAASFLRPVDTKRPFTPKEPQRTLFGNIRREAGCRGQQVARPASTFSLRPHHFEEPLSDSRPPSGIRLMPLDSPREVWMSTMAASPPPPHSPHSRCRTPTPTAAQRLLLPSLPRSASLPLSSPSGSAHRSHFRSRGSLGNLPEEDEVGQADILDLDFTPDMPLSSLKVRGRSVEDILDPLKRACERTYQQQMAPRNQTPPAFSTHGPSVGVSIRLSPSFLEQAGATHRPESRGRFTYEQIDPPPSPQMSAWELLSILSEQEDNDQEVIEVLEKLLAEMAAGKNPAGSGRSQRSALRSLYRLVDRNNERLLLLLAHVLLEMRVTGSNNLAGVCKLVFKVAKADDNDNLFLQNSGRILDLFLDAVGRASPLEDAEACVYGYGAIKFLCMNVPAAQCLMDLGLLDLMTLHLRVMCSHKEEGNRVPEQSNHALFQLTAAMRNVAGEDGTAPAFVSTGAIGQVVNALRLFRCDLDVVVNLSRTLSILSTQEECCGEMVRQEGLFPYMLHVMEKYRGRADIVVRLGYCVGNLTARCEEARKKFYLMEGALDAMLGLLDLYMAMMESRRSEQVMREEVSGDVDVVEDVMVKLVRIIANVSLYPDAGEWISTSPDCLRILLRILCNYTLPSSEELVLSTLSTLNNLTYYTQAGDDDDDTTSQPGVDHEEDEECRERLALTLCQLAGGDHLEGAAEATRVLGNLTRERKVRDQVTRTGTLRKMIQRAGDTESAEFIRAAVGVLVNILGDPDKGRLVKRHGGVAILVGVLDSELGSMRSSHGTDWWLASLVCQALWNYCAHSGDLGRDLGRNNLLRLLALLADCLDEEAVFPGVDGDGEGMYAMWEEFAGVGSSLMDKVETYLEEEEEEREAGVEEYLEEVHQTPPSSSHSLTTR